MLMHIKRGSWPAALQLESSTLDNHVVVLAKITSKNQLTLPKVSRKPSVPPNTSTSRPARQIILTPVRIQRGDAVRAKLAELDLVDAADISDAVTWARSEVAGVPVRVAEPTAPYFMTKAKAKPAAVKKIVNKKPAFRKA